MPEQVLFTLCQLCWNARTVLRRHGGKVRKYSTAKLASTPGWRINSARLCNRLDYIKGAPVTCASFGKLRRLVDRLHDVPSGPMTREAIEDMRPRNLAGEI